MLYTGRQNDFGSWNLEDVVSLLKFKTLCLEIVRSSWGDILACCWLVAFRQYTVKEFYVNNDLILLIKYFWILKAKYIAIMDSMFLK